MEHHVAWHADRPCAAHWGPPRPAEAFEAAPTRVFLSGLSTQRLDLIPEVRPAVSVRARLGHHELLPKDLRLGADNHTDWRLQWDVAAPEWQLAEQADALLVVDDLPAATVRTAQQALRPEDLEHAAFPETAVPAPLELSGVGASTAWSHVIPPEWLPEFAHLGDRPHPELQRLALAALALTHATPRHLVVRIPPTARHLQRWLDLFWAFTPSRHLDTVLTLQIRGAMTPASVQPLLARLDPKEQRGAVGVPPAGSYLGALNGAAARHGRLHVELWPDDHGAALCAGDALQRWTERAIVSSLSVYPRPENRA